MMSACKYSWNTWRNYLVWKRNCTELLRRRRNYLSLIILVHWNHSVFPHLIVKFIYSEKATKCCEIFILLLSYGVPVKSKMKILQNFVAFSEYMNFEMNFKVQRSAFPVGKSRWFRNSSWISSGILQEFQLESSQKIWWLHIYVPNDMYHEMYLKQLIIIMFLLPGELHI